jgi:hypothetical protein
MQKLKDSNKTLLIFKVKRKQTVLGHNKKELNYKKRATIELCATSIIAAVATRKGTEMDTLVMNSSKHTVKKRIFLYLRYG